MLFRTYPYKGWLVIALCCWCIAGLRYSMLRHAATPQAMTQLVSKDMQKRQAALDKLLANERLVRKIFADSLNANEANQLSKEPFYIYAFTGGNELLFWNNNTVVGTCNEGFPGDDENGLFRYNGTFYKQCLYPDYLLDDEYLVVLFPLRQKYAIQNDYLQSLFAAAEYIPSSTNSSLEKKANAHPVLTAHGKTLFYLYFVQEDAPVYIPDALINSVFIAAIIASLLWLHLMAIALSRRGKTLLGLTTVLFSIAIVLGIAYTIGAPFHLNEITLFSKGLFSSSKIFPSLALLLIVFSCLLWLLVFFVRVKTTPISPPSSRWTRLLLIFLGISLIISTALVPIRLIQNLVLDSRLSFDVVNLNSTNRFTLIGLLAVVLIVCTNTLLLFVSNFHLRNCIPSQRTKYLLLAAGLMVAYFLLKPSAACQYIFAGSTLLLLVVFDTYYLHKKVSVFSSENFAVAIIIAIVATFLLYHFNDEKKKIEERVFAESVVYQRDAMMEYAFIDLVDSLQNDRLIAQYLTDPTQDARSYIDEYITTKFLRGQFNRYQASILLFNAHGLSLFNTDTTQLISIDSLLAHAEPIALSPHLFYFENAKDNRYYMGLIPLDDGSTIAIALQLRKTADASVYPELLEPAALQKINTKQNYTYGIYAQRELISQNNDYPFPLYIRNDTMQVGTQRVLQREGYNINLYKVVAGKQVAIIEIKEDWLEALTLFSYIVGILMTGFVIYFLVSLFLNYLLRLQEVPYYRFTLRSRIHLAMISTVMLAFLVLGFVTIFIFKSRYENSNKNKLRNAMQYVERAVQAYLEKDNQPLTSTYFNEATQTTAFKNFITDFAISKRMDINIYNSYGSLNTTSQEDIFNKALLARIMTPDAYFRLSQQHSSLILLEEHIGKLQFLSSYAPVRNKQGDAIGYINVPFFSSQRELNYQISNILVALINIYVMVFLLSGIMAVGITNRLTKGFQLLIEKFRTFSLKEHEKIAWDYDDEIGLLLREYNKMVEKVIENARRLAQSERESAWREMAQQVAHEIKNPLTPMKLNVQYLQQAIAKNQPNITELAQKVSASIIEQIDSLTNIASAFSDFAKMPEALPETFSLNNLLQHIKDLHHHEQETRLQLVLHSETMMVYMDKNQLIRVLNNLVKNAFEAIPDDRQPQVILSLQRNMSRARIVVADNGSGISEAAQHKIFTPYFTTKGSGTGLGLAMTKKIVEFWNGTIWFETDEKAGTRFYIDLPLRE